MTDADHVIEEVRRAFASTPAPGAAFMTDSRDGCEPEESVGPFRGREWSSLDAEMLDANYTSLSFFSEAAFRYFIPAYLIADVRRQLRTADPLFHLTHGLLRGLETVVRLGGREWVRRYGGETPLNPRRYGAITWWHRAQFRLSVFSREESAAIVAYLRWRSEQNDGDDRADVNTALDGFWLERAATALTTAELDAHVAEEQAFADACIRRRNASE